MKLMEHENIGHLELENRVVMLAMHLGYCEEGHIPQKLIDFYIERAKYRPGLIIVGGCYTEHLGMSLPNMIGLSADEHSAGLSRLAEAVHEFHVPIAAQLYHAGRYAHSAVLGEQSVSASEVESRLTRETPRSLTTREVGETVRNFGMAALRAKKAGFDAVEILGSAGYLINQFLAGLTNRRTDEFGGDLRSRARFPLDVIRSIREAVGPKYPVIYRMGGEDFVEGGLTIDDNRMLAPMFERAGIDAFNVTGGWHETRTPQITMDVPRGHYAYLGESIAETVEVPVVACNRINSPTIAERILDRGRARLIGMGRGFLADAELPEKIRKGKPESIRQCIACNQGCLDRVFMFGPVTCAINPVAGYESTRDLGKPIEGRIAVVGAGPVGMEAARVLKLRGADVTLFEKHGTPGGFLRLAARIPGRGEFAAYVSFMFRELRRLGVTMHFNHLVSHRELCDSYDFVVCATGTLPTAPMIEGAESPGVTTAYDLIESPPERVGKALVVGENAVACYAALYLSHRAGDVHIITNRNSIGNDLGRTTRWIIMKGLMDKNVTIHKECSLMQINNDNIIMSEQGEIRHVSGDLVVLSPDPEPRNRLAKKLSEAGVPCALVGSADHSGNLLELIHAAFQFGNHFAFEAAD